MKTGRENREKQTNKKYALFTSVSCLNVLHCFVNDRQSCLQLDGLVDNSVSVTLPLFYFCLKSNLPEDELVYRR